MCTGPCVFPVLSLGPGMPKMDVAGFFCYFGFNPLLKKYLDQQNFMYQLSILIIPSCIPLK